MQPTSNDPVTSGETLRLNGAAPALPMGWSGPAESIATDPAAILAALSDLTSPCYVVREGNRLGVSTQGSMVPLNVGSQLPLLAGVAPLPPEQLGDARFRSTYGVRYAYATGAMANGIASEDLVIALGRHGILSSFGAAGLMPPRIEAAIRRIQEALPRGPYAFNLIHSPNEPALEHRAVDLYLHYGVNTVEASAFMQLTPAIVRYRLAGLAPDSDGGVAIRNRVIAKISRREVAQQFMQPAPAELIEPLLAQGLITPEQAALAARVPMADDITVEADSGGHTDNRPLVCLLPSLIALRDEIQVRQRYATEVRVGAAGGIGTPQAALAAFVMGAAYVVTGSINQSTLEAGSSPHTKRLLAQAEMVDVMMAPAADMFEMGIRVQVLKRGTMFGMRAQKLYELYRAYETIEEIPPAEREALERRTFQKNLDQVWAETTAFFTERDPQQLVRAAADPKHKMALIFRWYLGQSSRWSNAGTAGRELDYQAWCGPAMGAFNDWARGTYLEDPAQRRVTDLAEHLMRGAAYLYRLQNLSLQGVVVPHAWRVYRPMPLEDRPELDAPAG